MIAFERAIDSVSWEFVQDTHFFIKFWSFFLSMDLNLTQIGKVTLIKSLNISQLNHIFIPLPTPDISSLKNLNNVLFNFLWNFNVNIR